MSAAADLTSIGTPDLVSLLATLRSGRLQDPLDRTNLHAAGLGHLHQRLASVLQLGVGGLSAVIEIVLAERTAASSIRAHLVWTGPEPMVSAARDTAVVLRSLFAEARERVVVAGYRFTQGRDILLPLHRSMTEHGVRATFFLDLDGGTPEKELAAFLTNNWPFGSPYPELYYDPRTVGPNATAILHAKCVVIDQKKSLVTSANFTYSGQARNIEVGVLLEDVAFANALSAQLGAATAAGIFVRGSV